MGLVSAFGDANQFTSLCQLVESLPALVHAMPRRTDSAFCLLPLHVQRPEIGRGASGVVLRANLITKNPPRQIEVALKQLKNVSPDNHEQLSLVREIDTMLMMPR